MKSPRKRRSEEERRYENYREQKMQIPNGVTVLGLKFVVVLGLILPTNGVRSNMKMKNKSYVHTKFKVQKLIM